ncbi:MAG: PSD1 domain-containing protein [Planctomycetes bacterium]|nr:PSD1 domain-containing protein [Planctomycetota bacterium]
MPAMNASSVRCLRVLISAVVMSSTHAFAAEGPTAAITFEQHVRPILKAYCLDCHGGGEKPEGGLDLRLKRFMVTGGEGGPALQAGNPDASHLLQRIKNGEMPPSEKKVPAAQVAVIEQWIAAGAPTVRDEPETIAPGLGITAEERAYWAYQPVRQPPRPAVKNAAEVRSVIDEFVQAKLEAVDLSLKNEADRFTLLKRASFDLIGLPPTADETEQFLADQSPDAFDRLLDRLLASPHYGERWGRHWLDVAGYADSEGDGSVDTVRPYIYKFRDYVIRSFNADKPFDQFLQEQLAGDELVAAPHRNLTVEQQEKLVATGFLRMAADPTASGQGEPEASRNQVMADTLKIVSSSLLGLSVGCAQCHDHRYDPISQADYYQLRAIFEPSLNWKAWVTPRDRVISLYTDDDRAKAAAVDAEAAKLQAAYNEKRDKFVAEAFDKELEKHPAESREKLREAFKTAADKRTEEQKMLVASNPSLNINPGVLYQYNAGAAEELKKDEAVVNQKRAEKPVEDFISVLDEPAGANPPTVVFHRGDYRQPKSPVPPADLTIAAPDGQRFVIAEDDATLPTSGRRLAWARHLTNGHHPLLGRVLMNRFWLHHFGRGIVDTPSEFGLLGTRPTHPELLNWLATELPRRGWSAKQMHRVIMNSAMYCQSSLRQERDSARDADGALYSRYPVRRLEAEIVRDRALVVAGRLNDTLFGKPVEIMEDFAGQVHVKDDLPRRSIYIQDRRSKPVSLLAAFDAPVMTVNCERRPSSTVAPQSLMLMNGDFLLAQADHLAKRLRDSTPADFEPNLTAPFALRFGSHRSAWQYGYGSIEAPSAGAAGGLARTQFTPIPHFTGSTWQGGASLPDPAIGYVILHAAGGHAGNDQQHAVIRRWTAPREGVITVTGKLRHLSENGDGVQSRVITSRSGLVGTWATKGGEVETVVSTVEVKAGDTVDLVTDCRENVNSDSFEWIVQIELADAAGRERWDSAAEFHGPLGATIAQQAANAWKTVYGRSASAEELELACRFLEEQTAALRTSGQKGDHEQMALATLCQQLMSSNEFLYVD